MEIKSKKVTVNKNAEGLFNFLKDVKNFEVLMPDNISKFEVIRDDAFVFALKGMPEIALETKETEPYSRIVLKMFQIVNLKLNCFLVVILTP